MRFIHDNLYSLLATLSVLAAVICWYGTSAPSSTSSSSAHAQAAEPWNLPKLAERDNKNSIETINARNLFGIRAAEAARETKEPEWRVFGIARSGGDRFILLAYEGKPVEMLKVGEMLPDGAKIVQIENDRYFVMTPDNKKLAFGIYKHDPAK